VRPLILVVLADDVARAQLVDELRRYERDYRVEAASALDEAVALLERTHAAGESIAMVLAGSDTDAVLATVRSLVPTAKRVLLLEWGLRRDRIAVLSHALSVGAIDTVLTRPTGPRDEEFHTGITEDLGDWSWTTTPVVEAVKVVVDTDSLARGVEIRDLLDRLGAPTGVHAAGSPIGRSLSGRADGPVAYPIVEVMGHTVLANPTNRQIAVAFGAVADVADGVFDVAIVGAGPAGLAAAVYATSEGLRTLVLEAEAFGGQAGTSSMIRNYLGFPRGVTGRQLARRGVLQAARFGAAFDLARAVTALDVGPPHRLTLSDGAVVSAASVILACGVTHRRLGVASIECLVGAGVFYGSVTGQARGVAGASVVVVGAGNSGGQAARHLARHGAEVTLVARDETLRTTMSSYLIAEIASDPRIGVRTGTEVVDGGGEGRLEWVELADRATGSRARLDASALFVLIGAETRTDWLPTAIQRDERGFVRTGSDVDRAGWPLARPPFVLETSVPGVFAAGDVRANDVKRVATAVGEGAMSVPMVHRYLAERSVP
jgi:thioredoxin reductase (NADPH)